jgi:hypothetical protein
MQKPTILIVSHTNPACGIYQFGEMIAHHLAREETAYDYQIMHCEGLAELMWQISKVKPAAVIFNFSRAVQTWVTEDATKTLPVPAIGFIHDVTPAIVAALPLDRDLPGPFVHWICADPTLIGHHPYVTATVRPILKTTMAFPPPPKIPTLGTFGFGNFHKGHRRLVRVAAGCFPRSIVRLHIPYGHYGDKDGAIARKLVEEAQAEAASLGNVVTVEGSHDFLSPEGLLAWLAGNTANVFLYEENGFGVSSSTDYALAVPRPIAVSNSQMYRHLFGVKPSIVLSASNPLGAILGNGIEPLDILKRSWTPAQLAYDFDRAVRGVLQAQSTRHAMAR